MNIDRVGINSVSTRHDSLEQAFSAYAAAGFANVELWLEPAKQLGAAAIEKLLGATGLHFLGGFDGEVECFSAPVARRAATDGILESARLIDALGGGVLVFGTDGPDADTDDPLGAIAEGVAHALSAVDGLNVTMALEFNWSPVVRSLDSALVVVRAVNHPRLGVLFDPAHYHATPTKLEHLTPSAVADIVHVHLDDMPPGPGDHADWNEDRVLPGEGVLPLREMIDRLEAGGYAGYFCLEMFSEELYQLPVTEAARRGYASVLRLCS